MTCDTCKYYDKFYAIRDGKWMKGLEYQGIGRCLNKKSDRHLCVNLQYKTCKYFEIQPNK